MKKNNLDEMRSVKSDASDLFVSRERGKIYDFMCKEINKDWYGRFVWDIAIVEAIDIVQSDHILWEDVEVKTWKFYITCESSRWSKLYRKYIPKKVLQLFADILEKANAEGKYRTYKKYKYC